MSKDKIECLDCEYRGAPGLDDGGNIVYCPECEGMNVLTACPECGCSVFQEINLTCEFVCVNCGVPLKEKE